jgi:hypothetical protein
MKQFRLVIRLADDRGTVRKVTRLRQIIEEYLNGEVVTVDEVPAATEKPAAAYRADRQREHSERY